MMTLVKLSAKYVAERLEESPKPQLSVILVTEIGDLYKPSG